LATPQRGGGNIASPVCPVQRLWAAPFCAVGRAAGRGPPRGLRPAGARNRARLQWAPL